MIRTIRRIIQILFFLGFLYLFIQARYPLSIKFPVQFFLKIDPLISLTAMISSRDIIKELIWLSLPLVVLTLILGRVWCGWACPLGTLIDLLNRVFIGKRKRSRDNKRLIALRKFKYYLLVALFFTALLGAQLVYFFDPISLITRTFTIAFVAPVQLALGQWNEAVPGLFEDKWQLSPLFFRMNFVVLLIFFAIIAAEAISRRFYCRNICPLGALLGLIAHISPISLLRRRVSEKCHDCRLCQDECKMGAIDQDDPRITQVAECIECYDCQVRCPVQAISRTGGGGSKPGLDLSRRRLIKAGGLGIVWAAVAKTGLGAKFSPAATGGDIRSSSPWLIRPPGALVEDEFLARCIRCGECMKICPTNGIQPALGEAGLEGFWSPILIPRIGYCTRYCNLCGEVCPTHAISEFKVEDKPRIFIGTAMIDRSLCITWYADKTCFVCEEACSYQAISQERIDGRLRPVVDENKCVGCGECENKCPIQPEAAIRAYSLGDRRSLGQEKPVKG